MTHARKAFRCICCLEIVDILELYHKGTHQVRAPALSLTFVRTSPSHESLDASPTFCGLVAYDRIYSSYWTDP